MTKSSKTDPHTKSVFLVTDNRVFNGPLALGRSLCSFARTAHSAHSLHSAPLARSVRGYPLTDFAHSLVRWLKIIVFMLKTCFRGRITFVVISIKTPSVGCHCGQPKNMVFNGQNRPMDRPMAQPTRQVHLKMVLDVQNLVFASSIFFSWSNHWPFKQNKYK